MALTKTRYVNNGRTALAANITSAATTIPVSDINKLITSLAAGEHFYVTLQDDTNLEIVKVNGVSGSNLINCERGVGATSPTAFVSAVTKVENRLIAENLLEFARLNDRLRDIAGINSLEDPATMDGNTALLGSTNPSGGKIIAINQSTKWHFPGYPITQVTGTLGSGATTTSMPLTGALSLLTDNASGSYLVQWTSGVLKGYCRLVTTIATNSISWSGALPSAPASGVTYEIYRFVGKKMSDKVDRVLTLPDDFDAPTDGVTAANTAVLAALNSGKIVDGCGLTYKITTPLSTTAAAKIQNATFDISEITASTPYAPVYAITVSGSATAGEALTANFTGASNIVTVADNTDFVSEGFARLVSTKIWAGLPEQNSTYAMLAKVWKTSGSNQIILRETNQYDFMVADSAVIASITMLEGVFFKNVYWQGAQALGGSDLETGTYVAQSGLSLIRCINPVILSGGTRDINGVGINLNECWGGKITEVDIRRGRTRCPETAHDESESGSIGIFLNGGTSRTIISNIVATDVAVPVKIGGYDRISRYNTVNNVTGGSIREVGVFIGAGTDYTEVSNCQIEMFASGDYSQYDHGTGIWARGNNVNIHDNIVVSPANCGIAYEQVLKGVSTFKINRNTINANAEFTSLGTLIMVSTGQLANVGEIRGWSVSGNSATGACTAGINIWSNYAPIRDGSIIDNQMGDVQTTGNALWIQQHATTGGIDSVRVRGGVYNSNNIYCVSVSSDNTGTVKTRNVSVKDVIIRGTQTTGAMLFMNTVDCSYDDIDVQSTATALLTEVGTNTSLRKDGHFYKAYTYDLPNVPGSEAILETVTVSGAEVGMPVQVIHDSGFTALDSDRTLNFFGRVSATNTVEITINNCQDGPVNLGTVTLRIYVRDRLLV